MVAMQVNIIIIQIRVYIMYLYLTQKVGILKQALSVHYNNEICLTMEVKVMRKCWQCVIMVGM